MRRIGSEHRVIQRNHQEIAARWLLVLLTLLPVATRAQQAPSGELVGVPLMGHHGVTETVGQIMARERLLPPEPFLAGRLRHPRFIPGDRTNLPQNPLSPQTSAWPPQEGPRAIRRQPTISGPLAPQTAGTSFLGVQISDTIGFVPPDSMGDVGPSQIVVCVNGRIRSFNKSGAADGALNATTDNFFASVLGGSGTSDPRVRYDRLSGRWFITMITVNTPNFVLIAVSSGPTITSAASFSFFSLQADPTNFGDYDTLGVDANALYIGLNVFNGNTFVNTTGIVLNKANLLGGTLTATAFPNLISASHGPFTPQGVNNDDPSATVGYFIGVDAGSFGTLSIRRVSNPGGTPTISSNIQLTVPSTSNPMGGVPALGSTSNLDDLDDRLFATRMHNGSLWTAHNIQVNSSGNASNTGGRDGSRWYQISNLTGTPTLVQSGTLFDSTNTSPRSFWIPSCAMSGQGHMAIGSSVAGNNEHAEIAVAGRLATDALGTLQSPTTAVTSASTYNINTGGSVYRWGDFSVTSVDPNDDMTMWTVQEYCNANNSWGVRVIKLLAPPPATPTNCIPSSVPAGAVNTNVTLRGASIAGSGFFDPGASFSNHLSATVNGGGVAVNSVTYNNPTNITLNLTISSNATVGTRTVTVTNPDSQSATSVSGILTILAAPAQLAVQPASLSFGSVTNGQSSNQQFQVINTGGQSLSGTATSTPPFSVTAGSPFNLNGGQTGTVTVTFSPQSPGNFSNSVIFASTGGNSTNPVTGTGLAAPQLSVVPASRNYGILITGQSSNQNFSVINNGQGTLNGTATLVAAGSPFAIVGGTPYTVNAGQTSTVSVSFSPASAGSFSNTVAFNSNGGVSSNAVTGAALTPAHLSVSPGNQNFPTIATGTTAQATFVVTNTGGAALSGTATITATAFGIASGGSYNVAGFGSSNVVVIFTPPTATSFTGNVVFASTGGNSTNTVAGNGAIAPVASFTADVTTGTPPLTVTFTDTSSGTITNRFWNFGDSSTTNVITNPVQHTYNAAGSYPTRLIASGPLGSSTNTQFNYIVVTNFVLQTDLALTNAAPVSILHGQNLTYTLTANNLGPTNAASVTVTDALPVGVTFVSAASTQGTCTNIGGTISCSFGTLAASSNAVITLVVAPSGPGIVTNTAAVFAATLDPNPANNTSTAITAVSPSADVSITKTGAPNPVLTSQSLTYTLAVANFGPSTATSVVVTDTLPASVNVVSATATVGVCTNIGGVVTCAIGNLASNATSIVTIVGTPTSLNNITNLLNSATVGANEFDPNPTNNTASAVTTIYLDSVGDGIPDWWRQQFFGSGTTTDATSCATCDPDGDGFGNLQEYLLGTDPTSSASAMAITAITPSGADIIISFASVSGKSYELDWNNDLTNGTWLPVATNIAGTGGIVQVTDPGAAAISQRFYRVQLLP